MSFYTLARMIAPKARTNAFRLSPEFLDSRLEYLHFLFRDLTCRRWYRHLQRRDPLLFTCASAHEKLGGRPLCSGSVWDARLRIYIDPTCLPSERNTSFTQQKEVIWTKRHHSYNILQWRCGENVVKIIKRGCNSCIIEEEWSLMVINFGWVTI